MCLGGGLQGAAPCSTLVLDVHGDGPGASRVSKALNPQRKSQLRSEFSSYLKRIPVRQSFKLSRTTVWVTLHFIIF